MKWFKRRNYFGIVHNLKTDKYEERFIKARNDKAAIRKLERTGHKVINCVEWES